jgi:hypothetical protein
VTTEKITIETKHEGTQSARRVTDVSARWKRQI